MAAPGIFFREIIQVHVEKIDNDLFANNFFFILIIMITSMYLCLRTGIMNYSGAIDVSFDYKYIEY